MARLVVSVDSLSLGSQKKGVSAEYKIVLWTFCMKLTVVIDAFVAVKAQNCGPASPSRFGRRWQVFTYFLHKFPEKFTKFDEEFSCSTMSLCDSSCRWMICGKI